ncbi:MAG: DUF115 domain-containing protein, partial [Leptospirales bacterium]
SQIPPKSPQASGPERSRPSRVAPAAGRPISGATGVDEATGVRFLRQWTRNALIRLQPAEGSLDFLTPRPESPPVDHSIDPPARDVLYCGAGPGLLRDLGLEARTEAAPGSAGNSARAERLRDLRKRYFIVAADTALAPLLHAGLAPDLAISIDSGPGTYYHLIAAVAASADRNGRFAFPVLSNLAGPRCLDLFFDRCYYYRSTTPLDQWLGLGPLSGVLELQNPTRNAVGLALHIARSLGGRRLATAGADFRGDGYRTHSNGTGYTEYARERVRRCYSLEMYRPGGYIRRDGATGGRRTEKNEAGYESTIRMAAEFGVELERPRSGNRDARMETLLDSDRGQKEPRDLPALQVRSLPVVELREFLQETRSRLNRQVFADWNITARDLDRWFQILN